MSLNSQQRLYDQVSEYYDIGDFETFSKKMQDPNSRKSLYNQLVDLNFELPSYEEYELKISSPSKTVNSNSVFIDPDELKKSSEPVPLTRIKNLTEALDYNKNNPRYIMSAVKDPDPAKKVFNLSSNVPKFVMGIPTSEIEGIETTQEVYEPSAKDLAIFERDRQFKQQIAELKKNEGLSDLDAYYKVKSRYQDGMPSSEIFANAFDSSITGSLFRIFGIEVPMMKDEKELKLYREILEKDPNLLSHSKFEQLASGALSLTMPVDQFLFAFGGGLSKLKAVGKSADKVANFISKKTNIPIGQARVYAKNALERITGGAGGFAAFDGARSIVSQVRDTGEVDPLQVVEETAKGAVIGSFTSGLGLTGSALGSKTLGKPGEKAFGFTGEVLGLGTISPILEGQVGFTDESEINLRTPEGRQKALEGYFDAAGTIIGLKLIKALNPNLSNNMRKALAEDAIKTSERTGKSLTEIANEQQNRIKSSVELAIENKSPVKAIKDSPIEYRLAPRLVESSILKESPITKITKKGKQKVVDVKLVPSGEIKVEKSGVKLEEVQRKSRNIEPISEANKLDFERRQLDKEIDRLSKDMDILEKSRARQEILDDIQIEIDSRVQRRNIVANAYGFAKRPTMLSETAMEAKKSPTTEDVQLQIQRRSRSEQQRLDNYLKDKDALNTTFKSDPMMEVPLHPADAGRQAVRIIEVDGAKRSVAEAQNKIRQGGTQLELLLESAKLQTEPVKANSFVEVPINPTKQPASEIPTPKPAKQLVENLPNNKKLKGFLLQKEYADLDLTIKTNEQALKSGGLTTKQRERLEISNQKAKELRRDVQERAESDGIEMQAFAGIPNVKLLRSIGRSTKRIFKKLFGSSDKIPKRYSDAEIDRLYNNALERLSNKDKNQETISDKKFEKVELPVREERGWFDKYIYSNTLVNMMDRAGRVNTETSKLVRDLGYEATDVTKKVGGQLAPYLDKVLTLSGKGYGKEFEATTSLSNFELVEIGGNKILQNRAHAAIEGKIPLNELSKTEVKIVESLRDLIEARGKIFEDYNIYTEGKDGVPRPFKVMGREIAPRIMSSEFYRIMEQGEGTPDFNLFIKEFSKATGAPKENVLDYFSDFKDNFSGASNEKPTRTTQVEHSRKWKNIPHALEIKGDIVPLIEHRPFEYARRLSQTGASRIGVASVFGQEINGTSKINEYKERIRKELGDVQPFHEMVRALSGAPVEASYANVIGTNQRVLRIARSMLGGIKSLNLSVSSVPNVFEPLGITARYGGSTSVIRAMKNLKLSSKKAEVKALEEYLYRLGAFTKDVANFSLDPTRPISSRIQRLSEGAGFLFGYRQVNEMNEKTAAIVAFDNVERWKSGKKRKGDVDRTREFGNFTREQAELMVSGKAPQELYDRYIRMSPAKMVMSAQQPAERSRLELNRIFNESVAFETYAQGRARQLAKLLSTMNEIKREATAEKQYSKFLDISRNITSEIFRSTGIGALVQVGLAGLYGGYDNLVIKSKEIIDDPFRFAVYSWMYTSIGGVYGRILQSTAGAQESIVDSFYPYTIGKELYQATTGTGRYTYEDAYGRYKKIQNRFFPAGRVGDHFKVYFGFADPQELKNTNAIKAYHRWKFQNKYGGTYTSNPDEEIIEFRKAMKKAYESLRETGTVYEAKRIADNYIFKTATDKGKIAQSILGKRLLEKSRIAPGKSDQVFQDRKSALKRRIGEDAYERLKRHDALMVELAELYGSRSNNRRTRRSR
jgi:hypothetical protein